MPAHDQASLVCTGNGLLSTGELTEELMKVDGLRGEKDRFFLRVWVLLGLPHANG